MTAISVLHTCTNALISEYTFTNGYDITTEMIEDFQSLGYVIIR